MDIARTRYSGSSRKLVIALDIGTTFSGAAYAFLDPGDVPRIQPVTRRVFLVSVDLVPSLTNERQISKQSEPWFRQSSVHIVLR